MEVPKILYHNTLARDLVNYLKPKLRNFLTQFYLLVARCIVFIGGYLTPTSTHVAMQEIEIS
jgi:hypothetical protein